LTNASASDSHFCILRYERDVGILQISMMPGLDVLVLVAAVEGTVRLPVGPRTKMAKAYQLKSRELNAGR
jgi:hypothetical protein